MNHTKVVYPRGDTPHLALEGTHKKPNKSACQGFIQGQWCAFSTFSSLNLILLFYDWVGETDLRRAFWFSLFRFLLLSPCYLILVLTFCCPMPLKSSAGRWVVEGTQVVFASWAALLLITESQFPLGKHHSSYAIWYIGQMTHLKPWQLWFCQWCLMTQTRYWDWVIRAVTKAAGEHILSQVELLN